MNVPASGSPSDGNSQLPPPTAPKPAKWQFAGFERLLGSAVAALLFFAPRLIPSSTTKEPDAPKPMSLPQASEILFEATRADATLHEHARLLAYAVRKGDCDTAAHELWLLGTIADERRAQTGGKPDPAFEFNVDQTQQAFEVDCPRRK